MLFIATALYCEAKPFINKFKLKKDLDITKFQVFKNESIILIITQTGIINSAIALTYLFTKFEPDNYDILINVGVCGTFEKSIPIGSIFISNKIIDNTSNRTYYPDLLFKNNFLEMTVITKNNITDKISNDSLFLIDMEAAGIYQSCKFFLQPHQMFYFKIVSDYDEFNNIDAEFISSLINIYIDDIINFSSKVINYLDTVRPILLDDDEIESIKMISEKMKLSVSMYNILKKSAFYYKLKNGDLSSEFNDFFYIIKSIDFNDKKERKKYFEKLINRFT